MKFFFFLRWFFLSIEVNLVVTKKLEKIFFFVLILLSTSFVFCHSKMQTQQKIIIIIIRVLLSLLIRFPVAFCMNFLTSFQRTNKVFSVVETGKKKKRKKDEGWSVRWFHLKNFSNKTFRLCFYKGFFFFLFEKVIEKCLPVDYEKIYLLPYL